MNRIILAIIFVGGLFFGGSYYASGVAKDGYEDFISSFDKYEDIRFKKVSYDKGLFNSNAVFEVYLDKDFFNYMGMYLGGRTKEPLRLKLQGDDNSKKSVLALRVTTDIKTSLSGIYDGMNTVSKVTLLDSKGARSLRKGFSSDEILTVNIKTGLTEHKNVKLSLSPVFNEKKRKYYHNILKINDFIVNLELDSKNYLNNVKTSFSNLYFKERRTDLNITNLDYSVSYDKFMPIEDAIYLISPYVFEGKVEHVGFKSRALNLEIDDFDVKTSLKQEISDSDLVGIMYSLNSKALKLYDMKFKDLKLDVDGKNLSMTALNKFLSKMKMMNVSLNESNNLAEDLLRSNPTFKIDELSFKNMNDNKFKFDFDLKVDCKDKDINFNDLSFLNFNGALKVNSSLSNFFYDNQVISKFEDNLLTKGILLKDKNGVKLKFKFDSNMKDLFFNDNVSLRENF